MTIPLGRLLPTGSSDLTRERQALDYSSLFRRDSLAGGYQDVDLDVLPTYGLRSPI